MDDLTKEVGINHNEIELIGARMGELKKDLSQRLEWQLNITLQMMVQMRKQAELCDQLHTIEEAISRLSRGHLTDVLIDDNTLRDVFSHLNNMQAHVGKDFRFLFTDPEHFYRQSSFVAYINGTDVWITLRLPIGLDKPMDLYKVHVWAVPTHNGSNHGTRIHGLPDFLAMNSDKNQYTGLTTGDYSRCHGDNILICPFSKPLKDVDDGLCVDALVDNDIINIQRECQVFASSNSIRPNMQAITNDRLLIQKLDLINMQCGTQAKVIKGCHSCLIHVPCNCIVTSGGFKFVSPSSRHCDEGLQEITKHYTLNLAVLNTFGDTNIHTWDVRPNHIFRTQHAVRKTYFQQLEEQLHRNDTHNIKLHTLKQHSKNDMKAELNQLDKQFKEISTRDKQVATDLKDITSKQTEVNTQIRETVKKEEHDKTLTMAEEMTFMSGSFLTFSNVTSILFYIYIFLFTAYLIYHRKQHREMNAFMRENLGK